MFYTSRSSRIRLVQQNHRHADANASSTGKFDAAALALPPPLDGWQRWLVWAARTTRMVTSVLHHNIDDAHKPTPTPTPPASQPTPNQAPPVSHPAVNHQPPPTREQKDFGEVCFCRRIRQSLMENSYSSNRRWWPWPRARTNVGSRALMEVVLPWQL